MGLKQFIIKQIPSNANVPHITMQPIEKRKTLAVLLHTCDKYAFCWDPWYFYFRKYYSFDNDISVYFVNEKQSVLYKGIEQLATGFGEWSLRLRKALQTIPEENVLYLQEDFWPIKAIDLRYYFSVFKSIKMDALRICAGSSLFKLRKPFKIGTIKLQRFSMMSNYLVSHQASIWDKNFFLSCLDREEDPWTNEVEGTRRLKERKRKSAIFFTNDHWYNAVCRSGKLTEIGREMAGLAEEGGLQPTP